MDKKEFYDDIRRSLKLFYPEKTDREINRMIDRSYTKFKDIIDDM